jgi:chromosome segregation ATPase
MTSQALAVPVMQMARAHARHVSRLPILQRVLEWFAGKATRFARRLLIAQARRMQDNALWFAGAAAKIDQMEPDESATVDAALFDELRAVEAQLLRVRDSMTQLKAQLASMKAPTSGLAEGHDDLERAVQMSIEASSELRARVRDFRAAAQAYAANCCATYQAHRPCITAEALDADLRDIIG